MAVTMADISKLRTMTGAGMMDCKNALTEAEGNFDKQLKLFAKKVKLSLLNVATVKLLKVAYWLHKKTALPLLLHCNAKPTLWLKMQTLLHLPKAFWTLQWLTKLKAKKPFWLLNLMVVALQT
jgi:hypothetical protein